MDRQTRVAVNKKKQKETSVVMGQRLECMFSVAKL